MNSKRYLGEPEGMRCLDDRSLQNLICTLSNNEEHVHQNTRHIYRKKLDAHYIMVPAQSTNTMH